MVHDGTLGLLGGRKACQLAGSLTGHLFWQDTYYQPRALEKHADSILALVSQLHICVSGVLVRPSLGGGSTPGSGGALSSVQKNLLTTHTHQPTPSAYSWQSLLGTPSYHKLFWSPLSPEDDTHSPLGSCAGLRACSPQ